MSSSLHANVVFGGGGWRRSEDIQPFISTERCVAISLACFSLQGIFIRPFQGLVNSVPAVANLFCLNLSAAISQPWNSLIDIPCIAYVEPVRGKKILAFSSILLGVSIHPIWIPYIIHHDPEHTNTAEEGTKEGILFPEE